MGGVAWQMMHAEVLPPEQQACLRQLGPAATVEGFHLIGGTAVAIHLGHRQSVDFDWCTQRFPGEPVNFTASLAGHGVRLTPTSLAHGTGGDEDFSFLRSRRCSARTMSRRHPSAHGLAPYPSSTASARGSTATPICMQPSPTASSCRARTAPTGRRHSCPPSNRRRSRPLAGRPPSGANSCRCMTTATSSRDR
jgi:hypothetical protein